MDIKENFYSKLQQIREEAEQLDELRGKTSLSDDERKKLKGRIYKKHGKAWDDTIDIRKEKKSAGPADTRDMDEYRDRLARMHNKLDEVKDENFGKPMELGKVVRYAKNPDPKKMDKIGKKIADIKAKAKKK